MLAAFYRLETYADIFFFLNLAIDQSVYCYGVYAKLKYTAIENAGMGQLGF